MNGLIISNYFSFEIIVYPHYFITFVSIITIKFAAPITDEDIFATFK